MDGRFRQEPTLQAAIIAAYNFARRLKTLSKLTPYEHIVKTRTSDPDRRGILIGLHLSQKEVRRFADVAGFGRSAQRRS